LLKELDFAIDDRYKVKRSGDKKIVVKTKKKNNPSIAITVTIQSLSGVSVTVSNG
jgi:antitoxin component of MazEF toxin-antitoxin module